MSFDTFCGGQFWNDSVTLNTNNPDFTQCFEHTALVYFPVAFLFVFAPFTFKSLRQSKAFPLPWKLPLVAKTLFLIALIIVSIGMLGYNIYLGTQRVIAANEYFYPILLAVAMILMSILTLGRQRHGLVTSSVLAQTWFLLAVLGVFEFRTLITQYNSANGTDNVYFGIFTTYYVLVLLEFVLSCFADKPDHRTNANKRNPCPESKAGFWNLVTFSYFTPMATVGYRRALQKKDLWDLEDKDTSRTLVQKWESIWNPKADLYQRLKQNADKEFATESASKKSYGSVPTDGYKKLGPNVPTQPSVVWTICQCFAHLIVPSIIFKFLADTIQFLNPQILKVLISFVQSTAEPEWKGYFYAIAMLLIQILYTLVLHQYFHDAFRLGMHIKTVLISSLFTKALRLSNAAKKRTTIG